MGLPSIREIAWVEENSTVAEQIKQVTIRGKEEGGAVQILGQSLPTITPSVLLKSRKDLLPVLLIAIQQHQSPQVRDQLTNLLFNLIKRPDEQARQMIIIGCVALAKLIGKERTEGELLPQCWEQLNSKFEERRALVAESCGALAAYSKSSMRVSLILSILAQLAEDKSELVRITVVSNLAQLISYFEDAEKYAKVEELILRLFYDPCKEVTNNVKSLLVPVFMEWSHCLGLLLPRFVPLFMDEIGKLLKIMDPGRINESDVARVETLFDILLDALPHVAEEILSLSPFSPGPPSNKPIVTLPTLRSSIETDGEDDNVFGSAFGIKDESTLLDEAQQKRMFGSLNEHLSTTLEDSLPEMWKELEWLDKDFIGRMLEIICRSQSLEAPRVRLFQCFCSLSRSSWNFRSPTGLLLLLARFALSLGRILREGLFSTALKMFWLPTKASLSLPKSVSVPSFDLPDA